MFEGGQISEGGDKFPRKFGPGGDKFPRKFGPGGQIFGGDIFPVTPALILNMNTHDTRKHRSQIPFKASLVS